MRRRSLRAPFVVTVLAVAACGGTTVSGNSDGGGPQPGCPIGEPQAGTGCAIPGLSCSYPFCGYERGYQCSAGKWATTTAGSCNPPAPQCPGTQPQGGTACTMPEGSTCTYPTDPNGCCPPASSTCTGGVWESLISTCNPPPPPCPVDPPQNGASCASSDPCAMQIFTCSWGDCGGGMPSVSGSCDGNVWNLTYCASAGSGGAP